MQASKKVNIKKKDKKQQEEGEEEDTSDEDLQSMAKDCYEILDSDEEGAKKVVQIVEKAGGKAKKANKPKQVDPERKKEVSKANNDVAKNVKKIQKLINDSLKSAAKACKSPRCTDALKNEYSAAKRVQRDCNKFLAKLSENNKAAKEMTFDHDLQTTKDSTKQLESRKKAVEQLEHIMQGLDEEEIELAFNQCREAKKKIKVAPNVD